MSNINRDAKNDEVHSQAQEEKGDLNQQVSETGRRRRIDFGKLRRLIRSDYLDIFLKVPLLLSIGLDIFYF